MLFLGGKSLVHTVMSNRMHVIRMENYLLLPNNHRRDILKVGIVTIDVLIYNLQ